MQREDGHNHLKPQVPVPRDQDSDSSQKCSKGKPGLVNERTKKVKAKYSDDEEDIGSAYDQRKGNESDSSQVFVVYPKNESKGLINRKQKRFMSFYDYESSEQKKDSRLATITPALDKPNENKATTTQKNGEDLLWANEIRKEEKLECSVIVYIKNKPIEPPKVKVNSEKVMLSENVPAIKIPELKVATMEVVQNNELPVQEEILLEVPKAKDQQVAKANVLYEQLEGACMRSIIFNPSDAINEAVFPTATSTNTAKFDLSINWASPPCSDVLPIFVQPRKNPWNVWPGLFDDTLGAPTKDPFCYTVVDASKKALEDNWLKGSNPKDQIKLPIFEDNKDVTETDKIIADFFAEEKRSLDEHDIANYSNNIEISKIEINEEGIKRYHQYLKYHRGPVDHDIIFTTVETALNFIDKLAKKREQKKKVGFFSELMKTCLKSEAMAEKEKEEEEKKKKEKEENKNKAPLKPKMWLVFNRLSKEKIIICTPGEFYDSD